MIKYDPVGIETVRQCAVDSLNEFHMYRENYTEDTMCSESWLDLGGKFVADGYFYLFMKQDATYE
jgi:hypothetical protein